MSNFMLTRRQLLAGTASAGITFGVGPTMPFAAAADKRTLRLADGNIGQADPHKPVDFPGACCKLYVRLKRSREPLSFHALLTF